MFVCFHHLGKHMLRASADCACSACYSMSWAAWRVWHVTNKHFSVWAGRSNLTVKLRACRSWRVITRNQNAVRQGLKVGALRMISETVKNIHISESYVHSSPLYMTAECIIITSLIVFRLRMTNRLSKRILNGVAFNWGRRHPIRNEGTRQKRLVS